MQDYGSGRAEIKKASESAQEGPGAAEYLHFGRLIGEKSEESKKKLEKSSVDVSQDPRAELYLEKWSQEEEMSYSMFETLLGGGDASMAAIKDISFDDIMCDSEEGIQDAYDRIVMPHHEDQFQVCYSEWFYKHGYYTTDGLEREDINLSSRGKRRASRLLPSAPKSVINFSSFS